MQALRDLPACLLACLPIDMESKTFWQVSEHHHPYQKQGKAQFQIYTYHVCVPHCRYSERFRYIGTLNDTLPLLSSSIMSGTYVPTAEAHL